MLVAVFLLSFFTGVAICDDDETMALKFLKRFGYISNTRSANQDVGTGIRRFQEFFGLQVTGRLNDETVALMKKPRCGMRDPVPRSRSARFLRGFRVWPRTQLTYYVQPGQDLTVDVQKAIFSDAFYYWYNVSGLHFSEVSISSMADIKISFGTGVHYGTNVEKTCLDIFDGPHGILGHGYFPEDGRVHLDEDETFTDYSYSGINLLNVAVHEIGHALGLQHTDIKEAVMFPFYQGYIPDMKLHPDDIAAIQALYGKCHDKSTLCKSFKEYGFCDIPDTAKDQCKKTCFNCEEP